jgi:hypothetical protein
VQQCLVPGLSVVYVGAHDEGEMQDDLESPDPPLKCKDDRKRRVEWRNSLKLAETDPRHSENLLLALLGEAAWKSRGWSGEAAAVCQPRHRQSLGCR